MRFCPLFQAFSHCFCPLFQDFFLIFEAAAAKELAQKACGWDLTVGDGVEVAEETEQTVCLGIFRHVVRHLLQYRLGKVLHDAKLEYQR